MSSPTPYLIPFTNTPQQIVITLGGVAYTLTLKWNNDPNGQVWVLDIGDDNNNLIVGGIPLVTGVDLFGQFGYLNFGGQLIAQTTYDLTQPPTWTDLGATAFVYFVVNPTATTVVP